MDTFKKRQREMQRLEKQRDKAAKRLEKKLHKGDAPADEDSLGVLEGPADVAEGPTDDRTAAEDKPAVEPTTAH